MIDKESKTYIHSTLSWCAKCRTSSRAAVVSDSSGVYLESLCSCNSGTREIIAADYDWYMRRATRGRHVKTPAVTKPAARGCPEDCGLCNHHTSEIHLPVFSITNDCNLDCPICFTYNRPDKKYYKPVDEVSRIAEHLIAHKSSYDCIDLTGGEPTLHPNLFEIIQVLKRPEFKRILLNTNGLRIASDFDFAMKIKESGVQCVLSLNTFDGRKSELIHGRDISSEKRRALKVFEELEIPVTLLCVAIKGVNEDDIGAIARTWMRKSFVKSITIQNIAFTGKNGSTFSAGERITLDEVEELLIANGDYCRRDFFPLPSAHPLCYSVTWAIVCQDMVLPLTRIVPPEILMESYGDAYLLSSETDLSERFADGINKLWAEGGNEASMACLKQFMNKMYPKDGVLTPRERARAAQEFLKPLYIHSHMDGKNFDMDRVSGCSDIVPDESGIMIPACSYNLLYREKDERFWTEAENA